MTKVISLRKKKICKPKPQMRKEPKSKYLTFLNEDKYKILFLIISAIAILVGAVSYRFFANTQISEIITDNFKILNSGDFKGVFFYLLKIDLIFLLLNFFIGTSFIGSTLSFLSPLLKCLYIGYFSGYLYNEFELKGVLFCLLLLYPSFAITTTSLIFASNENVYMSKYVYNCINSNNLSNDISIKLYLLRYLLLFIINIVCISVTSLLITFIAPKIDII